MKPNKAQAVACGIILLFTGQHAQAGEGLATRDLNPVLQPIFLPAYAPFAKSDGWRIDHSLYITNTLQAESKGAENLVLDVENYRYELAARYRHDEWLAQFSIPFVSNREGDLDGLIEDWHDFFGLPNGDRGDFRQDELNIDYRRDGVVEYSQDRSSSGIGDISLAFGYQSPAETRFFFGVDLPTGSESDYSGNEEIDYAVWITRAVQIDAETTLYGLYGISFPGDGGSLEGLLVDEIWVAQAGMAYYFTAGVVGTLQFDFHSGTIDDSDLDAFSESLQIQVGLGFPQLFENHRLDLFFSEDILVGSAPDITFGARLARGFE
jgi:hypothetical protein